jgi:AcrR family transcriptional regulator
MAAPRRYPPSNALENIELLACKGHSTIGLAKYFGVSRPTITRWFEENDKFEEAYEQGRDAYRQTLEEQIIQMTLSGRNPAGLIYLLKAKFKMFDVPNNKPDLLNVAVEVKPVMVVIDHGNDADWQAKAAEQQRKLTAPTVEAKLAIAPSNELPYLSAPAWAPKGLR